MKLIILSFMVVMLGVVAYGEYSDGIGDNAVDRAIAEYIVADNVVSNDVTAGYTAADTVVSNAVTSAFGSADTVVSNAVTSAFASADTVVSNGVTSAFQSGDTIISNLVVTAQGDVDALETNVFLYSAQTNTIDMGHLIRWQTDGSNYVDFGALSSTQMLMRFVVDGAVSNTYYNMISE